MEYVRIDTLEENAVCKGFYRTRGFKEVARVVNYIMEVDDT